MLTRARSCSTFTQLRRALAVGGTTDRIEVAVPRPAPHQPLQVLSHPRSRKCRVDRLLRRGPAGVERDSEAFRQGPGQFRPGHPRAAGPGVFHHWLSVPYSGAGCGIKWRFIFSCSFLPLASVSVDRVASYSALWNFSFKKKN